MTSAKAGRSNGNGYSASAVQGACQPWAAPFCLDPERLLTFGEAIERVEAALRFGIDPSLEPVKAMLVELGHPELSFSAVQVAGTNGKTSTSRYTAALLRGEGLRCGLYTSPHLVDYTERVEIDGVAVSRAVFARGISWALEAWRRLCERDGSWAAQGCTEFELLTVAAMAIYAEARVDVAVLEVGLGGRWDATSAVPTVACAITGIGLDHTAVLGDTLEAIAGEKAAIIHRGAPCILGPHALRPREVRSVMVDRCDAEGVAPTFVVEGSPRCPDAACTTYALLDDQDAGAALSVDVDVEAVLADGTTVRALYPGLRLDAPVYQAQNVACALALATATLGRPLEREKAVKSLAGCFVPGRFEVVSREPLIVLDACHNPQSAEAFVDAMERFEPDRSRRPTLLLGALADKDHRGIVEAVAPLFEHIVVTQSTSERAYPALDLAREVGEVCGRPVDAVFPRLEDAVGYLAGTPFICCGTITLIGELKGMLCQSASHDL